jgi:SAM-dependent methyltransferase
MGDETRKANLTRVQHPLFQRIFSGRGIDIGCGEDRLDRDNFFPGIEECEGFDRINGDAQDILAFREAETYDFVYSSHCLEHLQNPATAIKSWFALLRPGGYMVILVPDEDLYEQGYWPSRFNPDHKWTFTIKKKHSWSPYSINFVDFVSEHLNNFSFQIIRILDDCYDYSIRGIDQSCGRANVSIELVLRKSL